MIYRIMLNFPPAIKVPRIGDKPRAISRLTVPACRGTVSLLKSSRFKVPDKSNSHELNIPTKAA